MAAVLHLELQLCPVLCSAGGEDLLLDKGHVLAKVKIKITFLPLPSTTSIASPKRKHDEMSRTIGFSSLYIYQATSQYITIHSSCQKIVSLVEVI